MKQYFNLIKRKLPFLWWSIDSPLKILWYFYLLKSVSKTEKIGGKWALSKLIKMEVFLGFFFLQTRDDPPNSLTLPCLYKIDNWSTCYLPFWENRFFSPEEFWVESDKLLLFQLLCDFYAIYLVLSVLYF